ncbi:pyridoxal phosphate-dependent decarboxylase family protein [Terricaulis sp.]|uniref:pyridoxal phosphate-dependent decarboxylase family protein n=1 Tax=Terricaulis sp. TaxID=2768686 RepID=UPI0037851EF4
MEDWRAWAVKAAEWGFDYRAGLRDLPVRPPVQPGEIAAKIAPSPPEQPEPFERVFADFEHIIAPGMTHWQHPRFFAYFPSNSAPASLIAEHLASAINAVCMLWQTSPAATELETKTIDWLRQAFGLPEAFKGCIQDTASTATLAAVLVMRERALNFTGNAAGLSGAPRLRIYCSAEAHSSIDRAVWFSGIGADNLVRIPINGPLRGADPNALRALIRADIDAGYKPAGVIANVGATGIGATDPVGELVKVAHEHDLYVHVDAAWAGAAMICPEFRTLWEGVERADSIIINPHKWLGAQIHCSAHFVRDPSSLTRTLAARPDYLHTLGLDEVVNYSEWGVPLGRQFRALKLWFVLRAYGLEGLRAMIRNHVAWSRMLCEKLRGADGFEIVTAPMLSLFSFRYAPTRADDLDALNLRLVEAINADGRIYLTQTRVDGRVAVRFQAGQFECTEDDVMSAYGVITEIASTL